MQRTWYRQIDGLRFFAILLVLIQHFAWFIGKHLHAGYFGVDLFFVISGFLITEGLLLTADNKPGERIKTFFIKRVLRIFPIYYLFITLAFIFYKPFAELAPYAYSYTVNYYQMCTGKPVNEYFSHLWSLCVEEQFYIFWPFLMVFVLRGKALLPGILVLMAASLVYFLMAHDFLTLAGRMFSLCMGASLAYFKMQNPARYALGARKRFLIIIAVAVGVGFIHISLGLSVCSLALVYLGSNNGFKGFFSKIIEHPAVIYVGKISYGIYLYHKPLAGIITLYLFDPVWYKINFSFFPALQFNSWIVKFPLYSLVAIGVASISYRFIEKPFLRLKDKL